MLTVVSCCFAVTVNSNATTWVGWTSWFSVVPTVLPTNNKHSLYLQWNSTGGKSADPLTRHQRASASVFTTWHAARSARLLVLQDEIKEKEVCWYVISRAFYLCGALTFKAVTGLSVSVFSSESQSFSAAVHTHFPFCVCAECVVWLWGCVDGCTHTLSAAVKWNWFRCGSMWEPLDFYLCNHRTVTPTWTAPGNKEATERREKENPRSNEFNKTLALVLLSLSAQFNTVWLPRSDYEVELSAIKCLMLPT